jgi:hypothetical protein
LGCWDIAWVDLAQFRDGWQGSCTVVRELGPLYSSSANIKKECSHSLLYLYAIVARTGTTLLPHFALKSYFNRALGKSTIIKCTSSVVRQMPGNSPQRWGRARTLPKFLCCYIYCVLCHYVYCLCVNVYCTTATRWKPNCS